MTTITKREMFSTIASLLSDNADVVSFCEKEIALLDKRSAYSASHETKSQREGAEVRAHILTALSALDRPVTPTEIKESDTVFAEISIQRISAQLSKLVADELVERTIEKRKSYFSVKG